MNQTASRSEFDRVRGFLLRVEQEKPAKIRTEEFFSFLKDLAEVWPKPAAAPAKCYDMTLFYFGGAVGFVGAMIFRLLLG